MLYACGSNGNGQLGIGHTDDTDKWTEVPVKLSGSLVIRGGGNHTVILEQSSGKCWVTKEAEFRPLEHPHSKKWSHVGAGWSFTILVDELDQLWFINRGPGIEPRLSADIQADSMTRLDFALEPAEKVEDVASGMRHSVILTSLGRIFAWGASRKGQCGLKAQIVSVPTLIDLKIQEMIKSIACGRDFTVLVSENHRIIVLGDNSKFKTLRSTASNASVIAGWSNFVIDNAIHGSTDHNNIKLPPESIFSELPASFKAMGSEHLIWVYNNNVYTSGWGEHGNCPPPVTFDDVLAVFGGCATSFVQTK